MNFKKLKRLTSILLSATMILSSNVMGFAAESDVQALSDDTEIVSEAVSEDSTEEPTEVEEHEHDYEVVRMIREANCTKAGVGLYKCTICDEETYLTQNALGHDFDGEGKTIKAATCTETGTIEYTCQRANCPNKDGDNPAKITETIPMIAHTPNETETLQEPTCLEAGGYYTECKVCHTEIEGTWREDDSTAALGHTYEDPEDASYEPTVVAATCGKVGSKTWHCTREGCDAEDKTETIPATGLHNYEAKDVPATCTSPKKVGTEVCSVCGDIRGEYREEGEPLGHDYVETVTTQPACTEKGEKTITCSRCDYTDTEEIDATGHTPAPLPAVAPTCGTAGKTAGEECSVCHTVLTAQTTLPADSSKHEKEEK